MPRQLPDNPSDVLAQAADIILSLHARIAMLETELKAIKREATVAESAMPATLGDMIDKAVQRRLGNPHSLTKAEIMRYMKAHGMLNGE